MPNGAAGGGAVAAQQIAEAIKASGAIVKVETSDFETILSKSESPLVVMAEGGLFSTNYQYLTGYKGLVFFTKSSTQLELDYRVELVTAKKIWIPG